MKKSLVVAIHLAYWMCYSVLLMFIFKVLTISPGGGPKPFLNFLFLSGCFAIIPGLLSFYTFYGILFPRFLAKKKIVSVIFLSIGVSVASTFSGVIACSIFFGSKIMLADGISGFLLMNMFMSFIPFVNGLIAMVIRGFITWYTELKMKEELNKRNYETELALVKSQLNPHFLFNTLNNIDTLIGLDPTKASAYLNKLSDIMRFMLYETKGEEIPLLKEQAYIEKYIDLQKIRTANTDFVDYHTHGNPSNRQVAPMLFIAFLENAFKHVEPRKAGNAIRVNIRNEKDKVIFECENSYNPVSGGSKDGSGLGNELLQKRLNLLYPNRHHLEITDQHNVYKVRLTLNYAD
jgi:two-component system LytT family sensor kinase